MDKTFCYISKRCRQSAYLLLISFVFIINHGCKNNDPEICILFTGDILLSRNVGEEIKIRNSSPWADLKPLFQSVDLVIGNLEGAVGNLTDTLFTVSDLPVFNIDKSTIPLLSEAGFNVITLENNHSDDLGKPGKEKTIELLCTSDITPVFFDNSPQFFTVKNIVIALVTINLVPGQDFSVHEIPSVEIKQKLRLANKLSNLVVVSVHWGSELLEWPNKAQRAAAAWLVKNGADIIIGSHPHIIQQPEIIDGKPVFFSLGNHLFDQKYPETKEGLIVDIRIHNGKYEPNFV